MAKKPGFRVTTGRSQHDYAELTDAFAYVMRQFERGYWDLYPTMPDIEIVLRDGRTKETAAVYRIEEVEAP